MITRIFLVRHGKSEASVRGIVQGRGLNIPLVKEGKAQSRTVAAAIKTIPFSKIFTSTALRAIETAEIIKKFHKNTSLLRLACLNERSKGVGEGMRKEEFDARYPKITRQWKKEMDARPIGGENFEDVSRRVMPIIESHVSKYAGMTLLYVIHGNVIRVILGHVLGVPFRLRQRIKQDYCAINSLIYDSDSCRWTVEYINKTFHS